MRQLERALEFRARASSGKVCLGVHTSAMSSQLVELYGFVGIDFVIVGTEVESADPGRIEDMVRAAEAGGTVPIVKLRRPDEDLIADALNAGAPMVMVPHITRRDQLERMIRATWFEPEGLRGECPLARYNGYGVFNLAEVHEQTNRAHMVIPIIEDAEALDNLEELMAVEEVDIFEIGPFDLSRSLGETGRGYSGPKTMAAIERVCEVAQRRGKSVLAPIWHTLANNSYPMVYEHQMNELISRGINCLYELETAFLALHFSRMTMLRRVRAVEEEPAPAPAPTNGKSKGKAATAARARRPDRPSASRSSRPSRRARSSQRSRS